MQRSRLVFAGARWKSALRLVGSAAIMLAGFWLLVSEGVGRFPAIVTQLAGLATILVFGANSAFLAYRLVRPARLVLTQVGFSVEGIRDTVVVPWDDVERFELYSGAGVAYPAFVLKPGRTVRDRAFTRFAAPGFDGLIAVFPSEGIDRVLHALSEWKLRYSERPVSAQ